MMVDWFRTTLGEQDQSQTNRKHRDHGAYLWERLEPSSSSATGEQQVSVCPHQFFDGADRQTA
jgi:hypothetical protein